ncbi:MAG: hypothetical protein ACFFD1_16600 [Candidatus Thorarchaeota archaeon]
MYLAFSSSEEGLGGILSMLPYHERNLFRSKQILIFSITLIPIFIIGIINIMTNTQIIVINMIKYIFIAFISINTYLIVQSFLFGKVDSGYSVLEVNSSNKTIKMIILFVMTYAVTIMMYGLTIMIDTQFEQLIDSFVITITAFIIIVLIVQETIIKIMFK